MAVALSLAGCARARDQRPSFLLVVLDTVRVDAVSAYGRVAGTTPATDALAAEGLRFTRAYAQAPWTLPSHATLFSGLLPSQHGVSWRRTRAPDELTTLAERLHDGGYETFGVSENPWVSPLFNLAQGFERFTLVRAEVGTEPRTTPRESELVTAVASWIAQRRGDRPFFLFVNVLDAHGPYATRRENRFLPAGVDAAAATVVPREPGAYLCRHDADPGALAILRGLYLGGVAMADAKLGAVRERLMAAGLGDHLVTIVTSDHGEHLGEHRLLGHQFSVRDALIHVPLVLHGLAQTAPAVIDAPVRLADVMPTVLRLARLELPRNLAGRPLPSSPLAADAVPADIVAEHDDSADAHEGGDTALTAPIRDGNRADRRACTAEDRVFGEMRALIRYPMKLVWYAGYPPELYDLASDADEAHDLAATSPNEVAVLDAALGTAVATARRAAMASSPRGSDASPLPALPASQAERLRALGYLAVPPGLD